MNVLRWSSSVIVVAGLVGLVGSSKGAFFAETCSGCFVSTQTVSGGGFPNCLSVNVANQQQIGGTCMGSPPCVPGNGCKISYAISASNTGASGCPAGDVTIDNNGTSSQGNPIRVYSGGTFANPAFREFPCDSTYTITVSLGTEIWSVQWSCTKCQAV